MSTRILNSFGPDFAGTLRCQIVRFFGRAESTADPDTFEKHRDHTPPISIAILLQKYALFFRQKVAYIHHQFVSRYGSHRIAIFLQKY